MSTTIRNPIIQGSLFEEDFLLRSLGSIVRSPEIALTEMVANAWDAGATNVDITIPADVDQELVIEDDGCGMTPEQFHKRWMMLGYARERHQGTQAEFPPEHSERRRPAYGRNGVGRHGLLCFARDYEVTSRRDGQAGKYVISTQSGENPFVLLSEDIYPAEGHGTRLVAKVGKNLPDPEKIRDVISARFLHDPSFIVAINGGSVALENHAGLISRETLQITDTLNVEVFFIDATQAARTNIRQGIAFWVAHRLVGEPQWILNSRMVIDGRYQLAKRHTVVVKASDELIEDVQSDWSGFHDTERIKTLFEVVGDYVEQKFMQLATERVQETRNTVYHEHKEIIDGLTPLQRLDVKGFIDDLTFKHPLLSTDLTGHAVEAVINLEKSRSGASLLEKLANLSETDIGELDRLLEDWTVRDALTVLDEIDGRLRLIEAINRFSSDQNVDELHVLHPLIVKARWLFGPEFDSPEYAANVSLVRAVEIVFGDQVERDIFDNYRRRPDLLVVGDSTISVVATEGFEDNGLATLQDILIVEVKRGGSTIGRDEINQAAGYAEDILNSGVIDGTPKLRVFVVGDTIAQRTETTRTAGDPVHTWIKATTYTQLVRTAERRLFNLRERLNERYVHVSGVDLMATISQESEETGNLF